MVSQGIEPLKLLLLLVSNDNLEENLSDDPTIEELLRLRAQNIKVSHFLDLTSDLCIKDRFTVVHFALATALRELLDQFRSTLSNVEAELALDGSLTLLHIRYRVRKYAKVFPILSGFVDALITYHYSTRQILNYVAELCLNGDEDIAATALGIQWYLHQPLFNQLSSWLAFGELSSAPESQGTFFIRQQHSDTDIQASVIGSAPAALSDVDGVSIVQDGSEFPILGQTRTNDLTEAAGKKVVRDKFEQCKLEEAARERSWEGGFEIDVSALPDYISYSTAERILLVGKNVRLMRQLYAFGKPMTKSASLRICHSNAQDIHAPSSKLPRLGDFTATPSLTRSELSVHTPSRKDSLPPSADKASDHQSFRTSYLSIHSRTVQSLAVSAFQSRWSELDSVSPSRSSALQYPSQLRSSASTVASSRHMTTSVLDQVAQSRLEAFQQLTNASESVISERAHTSLSPRKQEIASNAGGDTHREDDSHSPKLPSNQSRTQVPESQAPREDDGGALNIQDLKSFPEPTRLSVAPIMGKIELVVSPSPQMLGMAREHSLSIAKLITHLRGNSSWNPALFEVILSRIEQMVTSQLRTLLISEDLFEHLEQIRDYLLLGRGDIFQTFLVKLKRFLATSVASTSSRQILPLISNGPWKEAFEEVNVDQTVIGHSEPVLTAFRPALDSLGSRLQLRNLYGAMKFESPASIPLFSPARDATIKNTLDDASKLFCSWQDEYSKNVVYTWHPHPSHTARPGSNNTSLLRDPSSSKNANGPSSSIAVNYQPFDANKEPRPDLPRVGANLTLVGSATTAYMLIKCPIPVEELTPSSDHSGATMKLGTDKSALCGYTQGQRVLLARPRSHPLFPGVSYSSPGLPPPPIGAVWLSESMSIQSGFRFKCAISTAMSSNPGDTVAFSLLIQKDSAVALGKSQNNGIKPTSMEGFTRSTVNALQASRSTSLHSLDIASSGFRGIQNSLALQIIIRRENPMNRNQPTASRQEPTEASSQDRFTVVAALYGPPTTLPSDPSRTQRPVLLHGLVPNVELPFSVPGGQLVSIESNQINSLQSETSNVFLFLSSLGLCLEYIPPVDSINALSTTSLGNDSSTMHQDSLSIGHSDEMIDFTSLSSQTRKQASINPLEELLLSKPKGRIRLFMLTNDSRDSNVPVIDAPFTISEHIDMSGNLAPGLRRAWVGITSECVQEIPPSDSSRDNSADTAPNYSIPGLVFLDALEFVSHDEHEYDLGGLHVHYLIDHPLHVLLGQNAMCVWRDVFRYGLRLKAASLGLLDCWKILGKGNSSKKLPQKLYSGTRMRGGAMSETARKICYERMLLQKQLHPIWILRARLQLVIDALIYQYQVDTVETAYSALIQSIGNATGFIDLQLAVNVFSVSVLEAGFQTHSVLNDCCQRLLTYAERFIGLIHRYSDDLMSMLGEESTTLILNPDDGHSEPSKELEKIARGIASDVRLIQLIGSQQIASQWGKEVSALLSRLQFNNFFSDD